MQLQIYEFLLKRLKTQITFIFLFLLPQVALYDELILSQCQTITCMTAFGNCHGVTLDALGIEMEQSHSSIMSKALVHIIITLGGLNR